MGCHGVEYRSVKDDRVRETANDKILRKHGFTRPSYGDASFVLGAKVDVINAVENGLRQCQVAELNATGNRRSFAGAFEGKEVSGTLSFTVTGRAVNGSVKGLAGAKRFSFRIRGSLSGDRLRVTNRTASGASYAYLIDATLKGGKLAGTLELAFDGGAAYEAKFIRPAKPTRLKTTIIKGMRGGVPRQPLGPL
jgi:hypothetical protein